MIIFEQNQDKNVEQNHISGYTSFSSSELCMIKALCQFMDISLRCKIELVLKVIELRESIFLLNEVNAGRYTKEPLKPSMENIINIIKKEMPPEQAENFKQMEEVFETMALYQEMMATKEDENNEYEPR